jgi:hypothetical protein
LLFRQDALLPTWVSKRIWSLCGDTVEQMFVAQLSQDPHTNRQIVENFRDHRGEGPLELGRFVLPKTFKGFERLRLTEQLQSMEHSQSPGELLCSYQMGSPMHGTSPITYMLDGRQHVRVPAGTTLTA